MPAIQDFPLPALIHAVDWFNWVASYHCCSTPKCASLMPTPTGLSRGCWRWPSKTIRSDSCLQFSQSSLGLRYAASAFWSNSQLKCSYRCFRQNRCWCASAVVLFKARTTCRLSLASAAGCITIFDIIPLITNFLQRGQDTSDLVYKNGSLVSSRTISLLCKLLVFGHANACYANCSIQNSPRNISVILDTFLVTLLLWWAFCFILMLIALHIIHGFWSVGCNPNYELGMGDHSGNISDQI